MKDLSSGFRGIWETRIRSLAGVIFLSGMHGNVSACHLPNIFQALRQILHSKVFADHDAFRHLVRPEKVMLLIRGLKRRDCYQQRYTEHQGKIQEHDLRFESRRQPPQISPFRRLDGQMVRFLKRFHQLCLYVSTRGNPGLGVVMMP